MTDNALKSLGSYSHFIATVLNRPDIKRSTVSVWSDSPFTGIAAGEVFFSNGILLRIREELDFDAGLITAYGYEVFRKHKRMYWYDDFPHPKDLNLASTFPHHKHVPPDIKHNRITAPDIAFDRPNLLMLIQEIEKLSN